MDGLSRRRRFLVLAICCLSLLIVSLDNTIVNVALPSIRLELNASLSSLQWTIDAYTLVLASLLMFAGSTADRIGRRRTFQAGLTVFTLGSLACALSGSLATLIAAGSSDDAAELLRRHLTALYEKLSGGPAGL